jgi:hypothetical protein
MKQWLASVLAFSIHLQAEIAWGQRAPSNKVAAQTEVTCDADPIVAVAEGISKSASPGGTFEKFIVEYSNSPEGSRFAEQLTYFFAKAQRARTAPGDNLTTTKVTEDQEAVEICRQFLGGASQSEKKAANSSRKNNAGESEALTTTGSESTSQCADCKVPSVNCGKTVDEARIACLKLTSSYPWSDDGHDCKGFSAMLYSCMKTCGYADDTIIISMFCQGCASGAMRGHAINLVRGSDGKWCPYEPQKPDGLQCSYSECCSESWLYAMLCANKVHCRGQVPNITAGQLCCQPLFSMIYTDWCTNLRSCYTAQGGAPVQCPPQGPPSPAPPPKCPALVQCVQNNQDVGKEITPEELCIICNQHELCPPDVETGGVACGGDQRCPDGTFMWRHQNGSWCCHEKGKNPGDKSMTYCCIDAVT